MCSEEKYDIHIRNDACFLWTSQKWNKMCLWVNKAASIYLNDDNQLKQRCCTLTCNYLIALYSSLYHWTIINFCLACEKRHRMKLCQLKYDQRVAKWHIFFLHSVTFQDSFDSMVELYLVKQISKYQLSTFFFKDTLECTITKCICCVGTSESNVCLIFYPISIDF